MTVAGCLRERRTKMSLDKFINSVRKEVAKRFDLKTDDEIDAFFIGLEESAKDNQEALEKRDKMLRDTIAELCEAKRLLKAAVEDMAGMQFGKECKVCSKKLLPNECPIHNNVACILEKDFKWRYADEALKLLGGETDEKP
jgi:hypothetical protein